MEVVQRQMVITSTDSKGNKIQTTLSNINPAITDTTLLRTAATNLNDLTENTLNTIHLVNTEDITFNE